MIRTRIIAVFAATSICATAVSADFAFKPKVNRKIQALGGALMVPGSMKGHILIANMQTNVPAAELEGTVRRLVDMTRLDIRFQDVPGSVSSADAGAKARELGANAVVFVTSCDKCDVSLLCAPENGWTIINSHAVVKDAPKPVFAAARLRKELMRGFFTATGAMSSQYPGTVMGYVGKPSDIDKLVEEIPVDISMRTVEYLSKMGVTPVQYTTYQRACEEGWAPAPTNDVQKAIWDKVHEMPTEPIKIKPEARKVQQ